MFMAVEKYDVSHGGNLQLHNVLTRFHKRWSAGSKVVLRTQNITQKLLLFLSRKRSRLKMEQQLKPYDCLEIKDR